jgi:hypothetical protein
MVFTIIQRPAARLPSWAGWAFLGRRSISQPTGGTITAFPEVGAFPLHPLFQHSESLVNIVVTDEYLQEMIPSACSKTRRGGLADRVDDDGCANYAAWALRQRSSTIARP